MNTVHMGVNNFLSSV